MLNSIDAYLDKWIYNGPSGVPYAALGMTGVTVACLLYVVITDSALEMGTTIAKIITPEIETMKEDVETINEGVGEFIESTEPVVEEELQNAEAEIKQEEDGAKEIFATTEDEKKSPKEEVEEDTYKTGGKTRRSKSKRKKYTKRKRMIHRIYVK